MVGGELVLAAHADEQGAASPAGTRGQPQHLGTPPAPGDTPTPHPGGSAPPAAAQHSQSLPEQLLLLQTQGANMERIAG